jgi:hypothetical protein
MLEKKAFLAWVKKSYRPYKPLIMFFLRNLQFTLKRAWQKLDFARSVIYAAAVR